MSNSAIKCTLDDCRDILKAQEKSMSAKLLHKHSFVCRHMQHDSDSAVLYVAKKQWTNRFDPKREKTIGVFFSLWVSPELLNKKQFSYNLHSLRLRELSGYKLTSRKFADDVRNSIRGSVADWPNLTMDLGPLTIFEGHDNLDLSSFADQVTKRVQAFTGIHGAIDELMARNLASVGSK